MIISRGYSVRSRVLGSLVLVGLLVVAGLSLWPGPIMADTATTGSATGDEVTAEPLPLVSSEPGGPIPEIGGRHWRIDTRRGPVHVWQPDNYVEHNAGVVLYVHGYYTDVDKAWTEQRLPEQFARSGRNALFIAPTAPSRGRQRVRWTDVGDLLRTVTEKTGLIRPWGQVVAVGHSGAYRTLMSWLDDDIVEHIVMLDGLYRGESAFREWLEERREHTNRMTMIAMDTIQESEMWVRELDYAHELDWMPTTRAEFSEQALSARLLYIRSQYDHMAIVESGAVIPVLLQVTGLSATGTRTAAARSGPEARGRPVSD